MTKPPTNRLETQNKSPVNRIFYTPTHEIASSASLDIDLGGGASDENKLSFTVT